ncbi:hypothetical protein ILYODFUR_015408 [Ilyodon furcidens]|uniref:Uncharacterized protein n=1 Tax=Ilyodon furcidens TaxID=33524 RepID=A0ABV0VE73_9TELE
MALHTWLSDIFVIFYYFKQRNWSDCGSDGSSSSCNQWAASSNPCSVCVSRCVLGQDTSPSLPANSGQRARWCRLYGSFNSVSVPQGSFGYNVAYHCQRVIV